MTAIQLLYKSNKYVYYQCYLTAWIRVLNKLIYAICQKVPLLRNGSFITVFTSSPQVCIRNQMNPYTSYLYQLLRTNSICFYMFRLTFSAIIRESYSIDLAACSVSLYDKMYIYYRRNHLFYSLNYI